MATDSGKEQLEQKVNRITQSREERAGPHSEWAFAGCLEGVTTP